MTQTEMVLNHLKKHNSLSSLEAMKEYGMRRLANILIVYLLHVFLQRFNYLRTLCVDLTFPCWRLSSFSLMYNNAKIRAKLYGWPNTYVFTKAMGEMLLLHFKDNVPLIIIRPTMVISTYNDPFPGYIEGFRYACTY